MAQVLISIDRTGMTPSTPLLLSSDEDGTTLGILWFREPGRIARITWFPDARDVHGSRAQASSWQQGVLSFGVAADVASETALRTQIDALVAAIGRHSFNLTTTVAGAPAQTWACSMGSIELAESDGRTVDDLADSDPAYSVSIPVYPIPS